MLQREPIDQRAFEDWSMGFRNATEREVRDIDGYGDFVRRPVAQGLGSQASPTYDLLEMFRAHR